MKVAVVKLKRIEGNSKLKAFVDLIFEGCLIVKGFSVVDGANGLFVGYPSDVKEGQNYKNVQVITEDLRKEISKAVLENYKGE